MSRSAEPLDPAPDVRGRAVVWSAGSAPVSHAGRTRHPAWRSLGLVLAAVALVVTLAYAVQTWVVLSPPPAGASVPLWLPDQLPVDASAGNPVPAPTARPSAIRTADDRADHTDAVPTTRPRPAAPSGGKPASSTRAKSSGHGPARSSDQGKRSSSSGSGSGKGKGSSGSHGSSTSGGSSDHGSSGSSGGTKDGGSGHGGSDDHGSQSQGKGSDHGGSKDKGGGSDS